MDEGNSINDILNGRQPEDKDMQLVFGCLKVVGRELTELKKLFFSKNEECDLRFRNIERGTLKLSLKLMGIMMFGSMIMAIMLAFGPELINHVFK